MLITTCLSVAKCQYYPRYRKITLTVANLFTYLLRRLTETTEFTKKLLLNSIFNEVLLRTVCQVLSQTHNQLETVSIAEPLQNRQHAPLMLLSLIHI